MNWVESRAGLYLVSRYIDQRSREVGSLLSRGMATLPQLFVCVCRIVREPAAPPQACAFMIRPAFEPRWASPVSTILGSTRSSLQSPSAGPRFVDLAPPLALAHFHRDAPLQSEPTHR